MTAEPPIPPIPPAPTRPIEPAVPARADASPTLPPPSGPPVIPYAPPAYPTPMYTPQAPSQLGTNGLAIAALCCGIAGFIPPVGILAVIFGIIALRQIGPRFQKGKGLAITGIVLGLMFAALLGPSFVRGMVEAGTGAAAAKNTPGQIQTSGHVRVDRLVPGQCFDGATEGFVISVTAKSCTEAHESEVITSFVLDDEPWPGEPKVIGLAEQGCTSRLDTLVRDDAAEDVEIFYFYPNTKFGWGRDRTVLCMVNDSTGTLTSSVRT